MGKKLSLSETEIALRERVKELTLINEMSEMYKQEISSDAYFKKLIILIPPAMQHPEHAVGRIIIDDRQYASGKFSKKYYCLKEDIIIADKLRGQVEICYTKKFKEEDEGMFLKEERNLIHVIANKISMTLEYEAAREEKDKLNQQFQHQNRLAAIGEISAGIVHEVNNSLTNILGYAQLCVKDKKMSDSTRTDLEKIIVASLNAREKVKKLMFFSRIMPKNYTDTNLNNIINESLNLLTWLFQRKSINVIYQLTNNLPSFYADALQISQIIVNLVVNAVQAMPAGGKLIVSSFMDKGNLGFSIEDNGSGIPKDIIDKIFDPFFTTKEADQGTGLGLSVVHGIVLSHNGNITVSSKLNKGSRFTISFPLSTDKQ